MKQIIQYKLHILIPVLCLMLIGLTGCRENAETVTERSFCKRQVRSQWH